MQNILTDLTARLKDLFGNELLALILYGSAARGTYRKGVSDINVLVLLEKSSPEKILEMGRNIKTFLLKHRLNPRVMTRDEFLSSCDVFPLEYSDILEAHQILYGDAEILNIEISRTHLRYQMEEKLRGAVGDLRYMLLASGGSEKELLKLLSRWTGLCETIFRGLLRLKGEKIIPYELKLLLEKVCAAYGVNLDAFAALERHRQGEKIQAVEITGPLLEALKALVRVVDTMTV